MKKSVVIISAFLIVAGLLIGGVSCKKKSDTVTFSLSSLVVQLAGGTIDLNGATSPTNVPTNPTIVAGFSIDVAASSVTANTVTLINTLDNSQIALTLTPTGAKITIVPTSALGPGTPYQLKFNGIQSTDAQSIVNLTRNFTTTGSYAPAGAIAYWNFEDNSNDQVGTFNPKTNGVVDISYASSFNTLAGKCAVFNGTTSIIEIPNGDQLTNTPDLALCFWVKTNSIGHTDTTGAPKGHFVIGLGAYYGFQFEINGSYGNCKLAAEYELPDGSTTSDDIYFPGDGKTKDNGGWVGCTVNKDLTGTGGVAALLKDKWAFVVVMYNHATKVGSMYINGELMKSQDFNLWPANDTKRGIVGLKWGGFPPDVINELAFGFIQSRGGTMWADTPWGGYRFHTANHFGGCLDEVRIYHRVLTAVEIAAMYQP